MDGKKVYQIEINGVKESVAAVESLNKQLNELENRIKALEKSTISVNSSSSGGGSSKGGNNSALTEEERLQKEINKLKQEGAQLDAKIAASQDEIYKRVDATKQLYKETIADQKAIAAQERLTADAYSNTMVGMKQHLADLKAVIQTTDLGESDQIKKMTQEANGLTTKLKEMEEAYGQFGRNVGNYKSAADGFKGLAIQVGDVTKEFDNAKQALKELKKERDTLAVKSDLGIISEAEAKRLEDLVPTVAQLQSAIEDAGKPMDTLMDTMQSFVAITQVSKGLGAFFGFDSTEIDKTIKNLVALQNAMQGLQTIQKQIQERQGVGAWIAPFTTQIDKATAKLLTFNTALLGTGKAAKVAGVAIKGFSKALKVAFSAGILVVVDLLVEGLMELVDSFKKVDEAAERTAEVQKDIAEAYGQAQGKLIQYKTKVDSFNGSKKEEKKLVEELNKEFGSTLGTYKSLAEWQDVLKKKGEAYIQTLINQAKAQAALNEVTAAYMNLEDVKQKAAKGDYSHWYQSRQQDAEAAARAVEEANKRIEKAEENLRKTIETNDKYAKSHGMGDYAPQIEKNANKAKNAVAEVEKEMAQLRISVMKEGLNKTITQLEEERKQRIAKLRENGNYYKKEEAEVNAIIDKKILDAKEKHAKDIENVYKDMWDKINANSLENTRKLVSMAEEAIAIQKQHLEDSANEYFRQGIGSYGIQGKNQLSPTTQFSLGINSENKSEFITEMKDYIDLLREAQTAENEYNASYHEFYNEFNKLSEEQRGKLNMDLDLQKNYFEELKEQLNEYADLLKEKYGKEAFEGAKTALTNESYSSDLTSMFNQRISAVEAYWAKRKKIEGENADNLYKQQIVEAQKAWERESGATWDAYQKELKAADDFYKKKLELIEQNEKDGTITTKEAELEKRELEAEYKKTSKQMYQNYALKDETLRVEHNNKVVKLEQDKNNKLKGVNAEYYQDALQELRDFQTAQSDLESRQPVKNAWGITNRGKTNDNNRNLLASYEAMASKIQEKRAQVNRDFQNGIIDKKVFDSTIRELDRFSSDLGEKMDKVKKDLSFGEAVRQFVEDIQIYLQAALQSFQTIMSAVWDAEDNAFDDEQAEIDKENAALDEKLSEQEAIVEKHKSAIESIEDELATARGDRRQHLIDQLNAEMAAQRAAAKEEQKIQKQKEAMQKKQDELDKKRKKAQYKRDMMQAIVSGALAVVNGLATVPFLPTGVAMAALAAATTAAQIAIMASNKPYAKGGQLDGGVAQGNRHRDGGIKVLGGRAEIEGGEFITNRQTTAKNVDLLEFINSKKKRIDINDLMEFYSTTPRKSIKSVRSKFEDGGFIPSLPSSLDIRDQLQNVVINQDNRPIVVSVVDINNKQEDVRRVQALAGMDV